LRTHLTAACIGVALSVLAVTLVYGHDHWINHGKYLDPVTGLHCCDQHDCKTLDETAIEGALRLPDGGLTVEGVTFRRGQQHKSEDGRWYRCATRCVFTPVDG
jgi:hypothetical protein